MTLVPNHQRPLSGNKFSLFVIFCCFIAFTSSCDLFKRTGGNNGGASSDTLPVDTIAWETDRTLPPIQDESTQGGGTIPTPPTPTPNPTPTPDPTPVDPVVTDPTTPDVNNPYSYKIAFLAPFYTNKAVTSISSKSSIKSLDFYAGAKMALDKLSAEGLNAQVYAYDTEGTSSKVNSIMNQQEFSSMDLIIGPMKTTPLKSAAEKIKTNPSVLVSPWNPKTSITQNNPKYVQVSPSFKTHAENIMRHARANYNASDMVLVCRENSAEYQKNEHRYFKFFQDANKVLAGSASEPNLPELRAQYGNDIPLQTYFRSAPATTVFIISSWNEAFVSNFLRKVSLEKRNRKVVVYGMPQWMKFERIDYEYYERLNVHVSSAIYVNRDDSKVQDFRRDFYNRIGTVPSNDAFLGYDLTLYFGRQLKLNGRNFLKSIDVNPSARSEYFTTRFNIQSNSPAGTENFSNISRFENKYVNILKFQDFKFQLAE